jgi:hypothetical protein
MMKSVLSMLLLGGTALMIGSIDLGWASGTPGALAAEPSPFGGVFVRDQRAFRRFAQQKGAGSPLAPANPSSPSGTSAGAQVVACGKLSVWVPDDWTVTVSGSGLQAEDGDLTMAAGTFTADFITDELDSVKTTTDRREKLDQFDVRVLEGTATEEEEDEDVQFRALALDPGGGDPAIAVLIYGSPQNMSKAQSTVERVLHSLRPGRPSPQVCG